ncbi:mycothiol synthase [Compostimonas suwonensis]|uniref:Mycothiol acetyltransferase n=1 Tax=Compostimonas suwonensis TaxID=1048394 RepID=A0A2M9BVF5_9MICO|nr:mycothiol synthase [Compostimonas suwonensis]PJJ61936.1 mycothiol synthase [Compostimonas suwonensis]
MSATALRLATPDPSDGSSGPGGSFEAVASAAQAADGHDPFNEQTRLDLASGRRSPLVAFGDAAGGEAEPLAAAVVGAGELDLVVHPAHRRRGVGAALLERLLAERLRSEAALTAWSHGDHPAARALAASHGFEAVRTLLQLRLGLGLGLGLDGSADRPGASGPGDEQAADEREPADAGGVTVEEYRPERDRDDWVALNRLAFAFHPEQGAMTADDVRAREAEPWFDPSVFFLARSDDGALLGYNWLKVEPGDDVGEIYVIGVHPDASGRGLGTRLMHRGLRALRERGLSAATLYVEADNAPAVRLYRSLGFVDENVDVQYSRI